MTDTFVAVDVETANPDLASICQIGVATFSGGEVTSLWQTYINPEDYFDPYSVAVHGITEGIVADAPRFSSILGELALTLAGKIVVSHTHYDRLALLRAVERSTASFPCCTWLDSARVARRAWSEFSHKGYGLANVAGALGINFRHHDAAEDARATGEIVVKAIASTGLTLSEWLVRVSQPLSSAEPGRISREGSLEGPLVGEVVVFTGALSLPRKEAADWAAAAGCAVEESVNKRTTLLVVGDQDIRLLAGHEKSAKHRKAEELISKGQGLRILGEKDFRALVGNR